MTLRRHYVKVHLIGILLFIFPIALAMRGAPVVFLNYNIDVSRSLNFMGLTIALLLLVFNHGRVSVRALQIAALFLVLLAINYVTTEYASAKWAFNWIGFVTIFAVLISVFSNIQNRELDKLQKAGFKYLVAGAALLGIAALHIWVSQYSLLSQYLLAGMLNSVIALLTHGVGVEKQALGNVGALLIIVLLIGSSSMSRSTVIALTSMLIIMLPALIGIRTLILGLILGSVVLLVSRTQCRLLMAIAFLVVPLVLYTIVNWIMVTEFVADIYDRWYSLTFAFNYVSKNPFGLGNGGYHVYVERYNDLVVTSFGSERMIEKGVFWLAPESDVVYFIASWGILSLIFATIMAYVIIQGSRILYKNRNGITAIERVILVFTIVYFLMGIGQDNAGSLMWWAYFGAALGIVMRHRMPTFQSRSTLRKRWSVAASAVNDKNVS